MKKFFTILIIMLICLSFASCEYNITSIEGLMRPPKLSGESSLLQQAFENSVEDISGIKMKTPVSGQYRSSYLFFDLEKDGNNEALVFYSNPLESSYACVSVFKFTNDEWKNISNIKGKNEEIYEVNFADINGDDIFEILISWTGSVGTENISANDFGKSNERLLTTYSCDGVTTTLLKTESYTNLYLDDLDNNGSDEIVIFKINLTDNQKQTTSRILSFNSDFSVESDKSFKLTGLLEINNIVTDTLVENEIRYTRIFVDGAISEIGVVTEIINIDCDSFEISLPLYEVNQSQKPSTLRASKIYCRDIDDDGVVEIPTEEVLQSAMRLPAKDSKNNELNLTVWSEFVEGEMNVDFKCLLNTSFRYMFVFDDDILGKISATYNDDNQTLTLFSVDESGELDNELFSIKAFYEQDWDENNFKYSKYSENDTFVYGFLIHNQDSDNEYEAFIRENFIILN